MNRLLFFFKQGYKSIKRERFFAAVNILGLSLGMFCFIVTSLYVTDELTHDKWHENAENIYMPTVSFKTGNGSMAILPPFAIGDAWKEEIPGVLNAVSLSTGDKLVYKVNDQAYEAEIHFSEPELFEVFDFSLAIGSKEVLLDPSSAIISQELAKKHFGSQNPLGEVIEVVGEGQYKVAGVLDKVPSNSHIQFNIILPIDFSKDRYQGLENNWNQGNGLHYILVDEGYDLEQLAAETAEMVKRNNPEGNFTDYQFARFSEVYISGATWRSSQNLFGGNKEYVVIFSIIGVLMLFVATFNYINLTTARAFSRSKDLAVRKIIGSGRSRLILLQLGETVFVALLALILSVIAVEVALPAINTLIQKNLSLELFLQSNNLLLPVLILATIIIISGLYPAIAGSRFNMVNMLKGQSPKSKNSVFRKGLTVVQFVICAGLFSSALIIRNQAQYLIDFDMGYNTKNIMTVSLSNGDMFDKYDEILAELSRNPQVLAAAGAPLPSANGAMIFDVGEEGDTRREFVSYGAADEGFIDMYGIKLLAGKPFAALEDSERANAVMLNESALNLWDFDIDEVIGQTIPGSQLKVTAITEDFHYRAPTAKISPLLIAYAPEQISNLSIQFREGEKEQVVAFLSQVWDDLGTTEAFQYNLVEGYFDNSYARQETLIDIFDMLTVMLIAVAFLGLFALATFEGQLKEKELSIRKVLGANNANLVKVLNTKFLILIGIAIVIAVPVTEYLIKDWLNAYPYRISSTMPYYFISGALVIVMALTLLTIQGVRKAMKNPVEILRSE
jgi:putative ABC transport system permease protein